MTSHLKARMTSWEICVTAQMTPVFSMNSFSGYYSASINEVLLSLIWSKYYNFIIITTSLATTTVKCK